MPSPLVQGVYSALRTSILRGSYRPNQRLVETDIAADLGASRTPVREALHRLAGEGLIARSRHGWTVREFSLDEIREIYQVREALEGYAARIAAEAAAAGDDPVLPRLLTEHTALLTRKPIPRPQVVDLNDRFHDALVALAGNVRLGQLLATNRVYYFNYRLAERYTEDQTARALTDHVNIAGAVLDHDPDAAENLARGHVQFAFTLIETYLR